MPKTSKFLAVLTIVVASLGAAGPAFAADDLVQEPGIETGALGNGRLSGDPANIGALGDGRLSGGDPADIGALGDGRLSGGDPADIGALGDGRESGQPDTGALGNGSPLGTDTGALGNG